ncbi:MAG TPA: hypothetical protein VL359_19480 [bacterium]|nr:hypothetical protein [bacterium]
MAEKNARQPEREPDAPIPLRMLKTEAEYRRVTRNLEREERNKYGNFLWNLMRLDFGPKVSLVHLVGDNANARLDPKDEDGLNSLINYYARKEAPEFLRILRYLAAFLLQQARATDSLRHQLFLCFKAVDCLRMIVQHSAFSVSVDAESLVGGLFMDMGTRLPQRFAAYMRTETRIYNLMRQLAVNASNHQARLNLAVQLTSQSSYYDAFVQYQMLLKLLPPMPVEKDRQRGMVYLKMGELIQAIINRTSGPLVDGRKMKNFVDRYNRDYAGRGAELPRLLNLDASTMGRVQRSLRSVANRYFRRAVQVPNLESAAMLSAYRSMGENHFGEKHFAEAAVALVEGYKFLGEPKETLDELESILEYLDMISTSAGRSGRRDLQEWARPHIEDYKKRYMALSRTESAKRLKSSEEEEEDEEGPPRAAARGRPAPRRRAAVRRR